MNCTWIVMWQVTVRYVRSVQYNLRFVRKFTVGLLASYALKAQLTWHLRTSYQMSGERTIEGSGKVHWQFWFWRWWKNWCRQSTEGAVVQDSGYRIVIMTYYKMQSLSMLSMTTLHVNRCGNEKYEFWNFTVIKYVRFPLVVQIHLNFSKAMLMVFDFNLPQSSNWLWHLAFSCQHCQGFGCSGMWHCVRWLVADILGEHGALVFNGHAVKEWNAWLLKVKSLCSPEMLGATQQAAQQYIVEGLNPLCLWTEFFLTYGELFVNLKDF